MGDSKRNDVGGEGIFLLFALLALVGLIWLAVKISPWIARTILMLGALCNLGVRYLVGYICDGMETTRRVGQAALTSILGAPWILLYLLVLLAAVSKSPAVLLGVVPLLALVPGYYWGFWTNTVPLLNARMDIPFRTDAASIKEGFVLWASLQIAIATRIARLKLWLMSIATWWNKND